MVKHGKRKPVHKSNERVLFHGFTGWTYQATRALTKSWVALLIIAAIAAIIYSNIYENTFIYDDMQSIPDNAKIRDTTYLSSLKKLLSPRAIVMLTFVLNYKFGELNVLGYHLVNVIIHILGAFAVYFLSRILAMRLTGFSSHRIKLFALLSALVFTVHPLQTQAVTYTIQRFASMAALFFIVSVLFYLKGRLSSHTQALWYILSIISGMLAFLCKPNAASLPGVVILVEFLCFDRTWNSWKKKLPVFAALGILWVLFVMFSMGLLSGTSGDLDFLEDVSASMRDAKHISRWQYLCTQFTVIIIYLRLLVLPVHQNADYLYRFKEGFFDGGTPLAFLFLAGLAVTGIVYAKKHPVVSLAIGWFFMTLSVESSIIPISDAMFEHRLYLPMVGFSLFLPWAVMKIPAKKKLVPVLLAVLIIMLLGTATYLRNKVWKDSVTFWTDVVAKSPHNFRGHYNLGLYLASREKQEEAIASYRKAVAIRLDFSDAWNNLGIILFEMNLYNEAITALNQAIRVEPETANAHYNLGRAYLNLGKYIEATSALEQAVELYPRHTDAFISLGSALSSTGNLDKAEDVLRKAIEINPEAAKAHYNLARLCAQKGNTDEAVVLYNKTISLDPKHTGAFNNLAVLHCTSGNPEEAIPLLEKSITIKPGFTDAYNNLGNAYSMLDRLDEAIAMFKKAIELRPQYANAHVNLAVMYWKQNRDDLAIRHCDRARELGGTIPPVFLRKMEAYRTKQPQNSPE